ncbi:MAG: FAD-dependent oxidoreductase [Fuerstiella sp.]|nr:FAD-dependent oxidoreductase [Fuerstiella sp.]
MSQVPGRAYRLATMHGVLTGLCLFILSFGLRVYGVPHVRESAREIPIAYSVDVVVVGGSTYAVAAATSAARCGATVFLAAPRPYLGEDLCDSLRLSLPAGQVPSTELARRIFRLQEQQSAAPGLPFTYRADRPSSDKHRDTSPPSMLGDGRATSAVSQSIQYDGDVRLMIDLGKIQAVQSLSLMAFEKAESYGVASIEVLSAAGDGDNRRVGKTDQRTTQRDGHPWSRIKLTVPVAGRVRYLEAHVRCPADCPRILLGEILIESETEGNPREDSGQGATYATTPHRVKSTLDQELLASGVRYLHGCYATDVLVDAQGQPAGIVMANRAGRQAVVAKTIVDATDRAMVAVLAGAKSRPWPGVATEFHRVVLRRTAAAEPLAVEHRLTITMQDTQFPSFARAEQEARDQTFERGQLRASASLLVIPPDPIVCRKQSSQFESGEPVDLDHFLPEQTDRIFILSGRMDLPRSEATRLLSPCGLIAVGHRVGSAAGNVALALPPPSAPRVTAQQTDDHDGLQVREVLNGIRSTGEAGAHVPSAARGLPVLGRYDVVVLGGGTAGAAAGVGAARQGAKTLVLEYQEGLGGVGTLGLIGKAYHGRAVGFGAEVPFPNQDFHIEDKMEWYRRELRSAGADIWFGVLGCGAVVEKAEVRGVIVATPHGRGVILADTTIDATGNSDIAIAAGADSMYGADALGIALQGTGLPVRSLHGYYTNSDYLLVDESDMLDVWRAIVGAKATMADDVFDTGSLIQTRERRRVVGDHVLRYLDQIVGRTYPDSIVFSGSDYDSHGYPSHAYFSLLPHDAKSRAANHPAPGGTCFTPYRSLLPKGLDRMLVIGLGISMERDASAMVRMQRDISNQGYAAGVAAAMAAEQGRTVRGIDVRRLQRHLVETGALPEEVLTHGDSFPLSHERIQTAVAELTKATNPETAAVPLATILSAPDESLPELRSAYDSASGDAKLVYAKVLGSLGDPSGVEVLIEALRGISQWDDKIFQGNMAEYAHLPTPVDSLILALGSTRDRRAVAPILSMLEKLDADTTLSHHRAVALALEQLGDPRAAQPLASLLKKPKMRNHAMLNMEPLHDQDRDKRRRTGPLREIVLARVLYRCGDHQGLGQQILDKYRHDIRGLFARHAGAVLDAGPSGRP